MSSPRKRPAKPLTPFDAFITDQAEVLARHEAPATEKDPDMATSAEKAKAAAARKDKKSARKKKADAAPPAPPPPSAS